MKLLSAVLILLAVIVAGKKTTAEESAIPDFSALFKIFGGGESGFNSITKLPGTFMGMVPGMNGGAIPVDPATLMALPTKISTCVMQSMPFFGDISNTVSGMPGVSTGLQMAHNIPIVGDSIPFGNSGGSKKTEKSGDLFAGIGGGLFAGGEKDD